MEKIFNLNAVSFTYSTGQPALENITFSVRKGERIAVLGANGCGKSTLLKLLDGLFFPSSGSFCAFGREVTEQAMRREDFAFAFRRKVGLVFQNPDVQLFCGTVEDEIAFGPLHLGLPQKEVVERVDNIIELFGIDSLSGRPPYSLSGGEKKKVAIAACLSVNPEVLLLDEPTDGLDPRTRDWLLSLLLELSKAGKTLIVSTHQLDLAAQFADRILVLDEQHRLAADGSPAEILCNRQLLLKANIVGANYLPPLF